MLLWTLGCRYLFKLVVLVFYGYMPRSGIVGSYGSSIFRFLRNLHIVFHNGCTNLHSHQQYVRLPLSPYPCQNLLFIVFVMIAILTSVRWDLIVVLICISPMTRDVERLFLCLSTTRISSLEHTIHVWYISALILFGHGNIFQYPCVFESQSCISNK